MEETVGPDVLFRSKLLVSMDLDECRSISEVPIGFDGADLTRYVYVLHNPAHLGIAPTRSGSRRATARRFAPLALKVIAGKRPEAMSRGADSADAL